MSELKDFTSTLMYLILVGLLTGCITGAQVGKCYVNSTYQDRYGLVEIYSTPVQLKGNEALLVWMGEWGGVEYVGVSVDKYPRITLTEEVTCEEHMILRFKNREYLPFKCHLKEDCVNAMSKKIGIKYIMTKTSQSND